MINVVFNRLKAIARQLTVLLVTAVMVLGFIAMPARADSPKTELKSGVAPGIDSPIPGEDLSELQKQRREWQSKASSANEVKEDDSESLGEALKEKLNLEEIVEGYHPEEDPEKMQ